MKYVSVKDLREHCDIGYLLCHIANCISDCDSRATNMQISKQHALI